MWVPAVFIVFRVDSVMLPPGSQGDSCRFRWRQPHHSGANRDVWALDDISISMDLHDTLNIDVSDSDEIDPALTVNQGKLLDSYCGRIRTLT